MRKRILLVVACLALLPSGWAGEFPGNKILITSVRTGDTEIFVVDPYFADSINLTRAPSSQERYPMWSPDGTKIVFTSDRAGQDTYNLYVMDADGKDVKALTHVKPHADCYFPTWAGNLIYFGYDAGDGSEAVVGRINPDGSGFAVIGPGRDPAISPDGKAIAFTQKVGKGFPVFVMDADGKNVRQLTTHEDEIGAVTPTWSPDGSKILYSDQVGEALELFVMDRDGKNQTQLTHLGQIASSPAWSPDMKDITFRVTDYPYWRYPDAKEYVYKEKKPDKRPVWVMNADGSNPHILEALHFNIALDGSRAVWKPMEQGK
jgi:TolB protein